jgi:hypothetical protein
MSPRNHHVADSATQGQSEDNTTFGAASPALGLGDPGQRLTTSFFFSVCSGQRSCPTLTYVLDDRQFVNATLKTGLGSATG